MYIPSHNTHPTLEHLRHAAFHLLICVATAVSIAGIYTCVGFMLWGALNISVLIFSAMFTATTIVSALSLAKVFASETRNK